MGVDVMNDKQKCYVKASVIVGGLLLLWYLLKMIGRPPAIIPSTGQGLNPFQSPYFTTNPGIPDNWSINTGGTPFNSTANITVNTGTINGLANQYMPMFGLVGMTAVSG